LIAREALIFIFNGLFSVLVISSSNSGCFASIKNLYVPVVFGVKEIVFVVFVPE